MKLLKHILSKKMIQLLFLITVVWALKSDEYRLTHLSCKGRDYCIKFDIWNHYCENGFDNNPRTLFYYFLETVDCYCPVPYVAYRVGNTGYCFQYSNDTKDYLDERRNSARIDYQSAAINMIYSNLIYHKSLTNVLLHPKTMTITDWVGLNIKLYLQSLNVNTFGLTNVDIDKIMFLQRSDETPLEDNKVIVNVSFTAMIINDNNKLISETKLVHIGKFVFNSKGIRVVSLRIRELDYVETYRVFDDVWIDPIHSDSNTYSYLIIPAQYQIMQLY